MYNYIMLSKLKRTCQLVLGKHCLCIVAFKMLKAECKLGHGHVFRSADVDALLDLNCRIS